MDECFEHRFRAPSTPAQELSHYRTHFDSIREVRLDRLTTQVCRRWIEGLDQGFRAARAPLDSPTHCGTATTCCEPQVEHRLIVTNPMAALVRPKVPKPSPKYLTDREVKQLLSVVNRSGDWRAIARHLMLRLGLRRGEALGLTWRDVDFESGSITIACQLQRIPDTEDLDRTCFALVAPKTEASIRTLVADRHLFGSLEALRSPSVEASESVNLILSLGGGVPVDPDAMTAWLRAMGQTVEIVCTPHRLRHTSATMMLNHNVATTTVGAVLGHTDIRTTGVYARVLDDTKSAALSSP